MIRLSTPASRFSPASLSRPIVTLLLLLTTAFTQAIPQSGAYLSVSSITSRANKVECGRLSDNLSIRAEGRGAPYISLSDGRQLITPYSGPAELIQSLEDNTARPLALASADYDEDGVPDLVCGYESEGRGIITLHRGNVDSIYPNSPEARYRKQTGQFTDAPFLSPARVFKVEVRPDFLAAGDFDNDGHWDVAAAEQGATRLELLSGDGRSGLRQSRQVELSGEVTAMTCGEINRADGLADIVVAVEEGAGAKLLVYEGPDGAVNSWPEEIVLPERASGLALGQIDDGYEMDLAVAAGNHLTIVHGRDRKLSLDESRRIAVPAARISERIHSARIRAVTVGDFTVRPGLDVAMLFEDESVQVLSCESLNRDSLWPASVSNGLDGREAMEVMRTEAGRKEHLGLVRARVSTSRDDSLLVLGKTTRRIHIVDRIARSGGDEAVIEVRRAELEVETEPVTVIPMRLNQDAMSDLVVLTAGSDYPTIVETQQQSGLIVTNTNDSGAGSLRQAIIDANERPGPDAITFAIGSGLQTITLQSGLPTIEETVIIDATTQPGYAGIPIVELNGTNAGEFQNGLLLDTSSCVVRGLVINRFGFAGINILNGANNNVIEGNYIGTDASGTARLGNRAHGINLSTASNNLIGGTTNSARNIISASMLGDGIRAGDLPAQIPAGTGNKIQGNLIGTDITGTADLGSQGAGIIIVAGSSNTIGGTTTGAGNVLSGNNLDGVRLAFTRGSLVQGNLIGTDITGTADLGNTVDGVIISEGASMNTVGGTTTAARNILSGNDQTGVRINTGAKDNLVQGNFIGTNAANASASAALPAYINPAATGDLSIAISDSPRPVASGNRLTYTIQVRNSGPDAASDVTVNTSTPVSTTFASIQANGSVLAPAVGGAGAVTIALGSVASGGSAAITLVVNVVAAAGSTVSSTTTITGSSTDTNQSNNAATTATPVQGGGILALSWEQIPVSTGNPTPSPRNLQARPGTGILSGLGNKAAGVVVLDPGGTNNIIGGAAVGAGNVIAGNGSDGVFVGNGAGTSNSILSNSIFSNTGLGIRIGAGSNNNIQAPVLTSATGTTIRGSLNGFPNIAFRIEFFANVACDSSGGGEGETFIGSTDVTANGGGTSFTFVTTVPVGQSITATATDPQGNTSGFSACVRAGSGTQADNLYAVGAGTNEQASGATAIRVANVFPAQTGPCGLVGYNIYISSTQPVQTVPANLWRSVPATNTASAPAAPAGSFYVVTTLWNCNGNITESGGSNQVGVPGGPTLGSIKVSGKLKISGSGFSSPAEVFIDGIGFAKSAKVSGKVVQKGPLTDGRNIADAVPQGRAVLFSVRNANGGISSTSFTKQ